MDRINGLSDDIICHILSFLRIKESALTSILSKRWRNLFAFTPKFHFDDCEVGSGQSFIDLIDRLLVVSGNFPLRKISIKCRKSIINLEVSDHVTRWMKRALNRGVLGINIDIITSGEVILVPLEIFTSKTMVELKLGKLFSAMSPEVVYLPSLKTLYLDTVYFHIDSTSALLHINMVNITKLTSDNYMTWSLQVHSLLDGYDLAGFLDGTSIPPDPTTIVNEQSTPNPAYAKWHCQDKFIYGALLGTLSPSI
ncbi:PREDICTED: F-box protein At4g22280-like [Camelina sativa]|uniref:F-box protein At4g22280-like n=1 Tax=Camelina sativa TaxID=90675 RepID=A0ABM1R6C7_CAMSA|nr:PREDICTED: F-box protein At4g22280-like [Camelina sativa]